jgi:putative DNA primase/helicase
MSRIQVEVKSTSSNPVLDAALEYLRAGICIIPVRRDGSKAPALETWEEYQERLPTEAEALAWWGKRNPPGIAMLCGKVSGNRVVIDFDREAEVIYPRWQELVEAERPGLLAKVAATRSPGPGWHRCFVAPSGTKTGKLAMPSAAEQAPEKARFERENKAYKAGLGPRPGKTHLTLVELLGDRHYVLVPGCPVECHKRRLSYVKEGGPSLAELQPLGADEVEVLLRCARSFNRFVKVERARPPEEKSGPRKTKAQRPATACQDENGPTRPGDDFDLRGPDWGEILCPHGWALASGLPGQKRCWSRPGKDPADGHSATTGVCFGPRGEELLYVFSTNAGPFEADRSYGKFWAHALLNHGGRLDDAARDVARQGFGSMADGRAARTRQADRPNGEAPPPPPTPPATPGVADGERPAHEAADDPHRLARLFLQRHRHPRGLSTLRRWRQEWHEWKAGAYRPVKDEAIRQDLTVAIKGEFDRLNRAAVRRWEQGGKKGRRPVARKVTTGLLGNVTQALGSLTGLADDVDAPSWLDDTTGGASEWVACPNTLLHVPTFVAGNGGFRDPTPAFFSPVVLEFDFDASAGEPVEWLSFLNSVWPSDQPSIDTLQEWFGYCLLTDTRLHKMLLILGPTRAGKRIITSILTALVGAGNVANPTFGDLGGSFGLAPLLGKTLAVIPDARLGWRADEATVTERLLSITGEDTQPVNRKFKDPLYVRLPVRFVITTNLLPSMSDSSQALAGRLLVLRQTKSWMGNEDLFLLDRLKPELPGILLWALEGWRRLCQRGRFVQPETGADLLRTFEDLTNPVGCFLRECCVAGPDCRARPEDLYGRWRRWCEQTGNEPGQIGLFCRNLRGTLPELEDVWPRGKLGRQHHYRGVRLRLPGEDEEEAND